MPLVRAQDIESGECFRKKQGTFVYLRISDSSVLFLGLSPGAVYGVGYNGNVAVLDPETKVHPAKLEDFLTLRGQEEDWNAMVGAQKADHQFQEPPEGFNRARCGRCGLTRDEHCQNPASTDV